MWIGTQSSQEEKEKAVQFAQRFIQEADDGRDKDIPIIAIRAGAEPSLFSCHFMGWDPELTKKNVFADPYQARLDAIAADNAKKAGMAAPLPAPAPAPVPVRIDSTSSISVADPPKPGSFTLDELKGALPSGVDPTRKEEYLDDATFKSVFNMERAAFHALPKWKRDDAKKKQGLF